jgi:hypothetical protein
MVTDSIVVCVLRTKLKAFVPHFLSYLMHSWELTELDTRMPIDKAFGIICSLVESGTDFKPVLKPFSLEANYHDRCTRKFSIQGERDGTACAVV